MSRVKIPVEEQLQPFHDDRSASLASRLQAFIRQQLASWPALAAAQRDLGRAMRRTLHLPDSDIELQCNPGRTRSTTANVAADEVAKRACFLCPENLYPEQRGLPFTPDWLILNNPFPIFKDHLTISSSHHSDQLLAPALPVMVDFVAELNGCFSTFYNGARCGASAPDHLHFQACPAKILPLEGRLGPLLEKPFPENAPWSFHTFDNRGIGLCRASSAPELLKHLHGMYAHLNRGAPPGREADVNLIVFSHGSTLAAACLPRRAHRPACFSASGDAQLVISPGAVDVGGLVILPRQQDFDRMTEEKMLEIYRQVCLPATVMAKSEKR